MFSTIAGIELAYATVDEYVTCSNNDCEFKFTGNQEESP